MQHQKKKPRQFLYEKNPLNHTITVPFIIIFLPTTIPMPDLSGFWKNEKLLPSLNSSVISGCTSDGKKGMTKIPAVFFFGIVFKDNLQFFVFCCFLIKFASLYFFVFLPVAFGSCTVCFFVRVVLLNTTARTSQK